jgi:hypothetical protein
MTPIEIAISLGSFATAGATLTYVSYLVKTSGRDRPHNPEAVRHLLDTAPYDRLDNILSRE